MNAPRATVAFGLAALLGVVPSCTFNGVFERKQVSGLQWDVSEGE